MKKEFYQYVKIPYEVALQMSLAHIRKRVADGQIIINQSEAMSLEGETFADKVQKAGGVLLSESEAKEEISHPYVENSTDIINHTLETENQEKEENHE